MERRELPQRRWQAGMKVRIEPVWEWGCVGDYWKVGEGNEEEDRGESVEGGGGGEGCGGI
jgi:hypothetical protein